MREVVIAIPKADEDQNIEIEVRINGKKKKLNYRIEIVGFEDEKVSSEVKVTTLQKVIREYDKHWELIQIGAPKHEKIPIMFRKKLNNT